MPLTKHGLKDATRDPEVLRVWFRRWPAAICAIVTGAASGVVGLDIDLHDARRDGRWSLDLLYGVTAPPPTPVALTPSGGQHWLLQWPGFEVRSSSGRLGPGLDVRGDGGSLTLPPGPGRLWRPNTLSLPLAPFPAWAVLREQAKDRAQHMAYRHMQEGVSNYAKHALVSACQRIERAPAGNQGDTFNREVFSIGRLCGRRLLPVEDAVQALRVAAHHMPNHFPRRPWRTRELESRLERSFTEGYNAGSR